MASRTEKMATETEWKTARSRPVELIVPAKVEEEKKMKKIEIFWKDHESESESESKKTTTTNSSSSGPTITKTSGSKSDSESLRRLDSKSGSGYDSAGNKTTPNKVALRLGRVSYRSSLISRKRFSIGKPGSKKRQRWLNQLELGRDQEALFDTGSYEAWRIFFAEQKDSPLKVIFENPALRALWKEFLDVTEEEQERMFQKLGLSSRYDLDEADVPQDPRDDDDNGDGDGDGDGDEISTDPDWRSVDADSPFDYQSLFLEDPELSFKRVEKNVRKVARKMGHDSLLMRAIDHSILSFLSMEMHRPEIPFFSDSFSFLLPEVFDKINQRLIVRSDDRAILQLILPEPFERLLTHNACKYYGLRSQSFEDEGGESCVLIGPLDEVQFPRKSLTRYLFSHNPSDPDSLYWSTPSSSSSSAHGSGSSSRKRSKKRSKSTSHKQTDSRTAKALERRQKLVAEGGML